MATIALWRLLALQALGACTATAPNPAPTTALPIAGGTQDRRFVTQAALGEMFEVQSSQVALRKSHRPAVRAFAQRMLDEHTRNARLIADLAARRGIPLPTELDGVRQERVALLATSDRQFDNDYLDGQIAGHRDAAGLYRTEVDSGTDPELKSAARTMLPPVEQQLAAAQRLRGR